MTFKIARSVINSLPYDYLQEVVGFRDAKLAHRFTLEPAPHAADIVEFAVRRVPVDGAADDFVIDVEIVEDLPPEPPPPTLAERKAALVGQLNQSQDIAMLSVVSPARERLLLLDVNAIRPDKDGKITADLQALLDRVADISARRNVIQRYFVNLEIEVEDLTEASIDAWTFKPFGS